MNSINLIGNLTRDAERVQTQGGTALAKFGIAWNDYKKEAHFYDCTLWGPAAESIGQYLTKGKKIGISGELRQERWQDKDGGNRSKHVINVRNVTFASGAGDGGGQGSESRWGPSTTPIATPLPKAVEAVEEAATQEIPF